MILNEKREKLVFCLKRSTKTVVFEDGREEVDPEMKTGKASTYSHQDAFITNSLKSRTTIIFSPAS